MTLLLLICWIIFLAPFIAVLCYLGKFKEFWQFLGLVFGMLLLIGASFVAFIVLCLM